MRDAKEKKKGSSDLFRTIPLFMNENFNSLLTHNASFRVFEEGDDGLDFRTVGHLIPDLLDHIKHAGLTMEEQAIGIGDVLLHLLVDTCNIHHRGVRSAIDHRIATSDDKRRHIVGESAACLD